MSNAHPPSTPAVRRALAYLSRLVSEWPQGADPALPSIAGLASMAGVSLVTMWRAVAVLRRQGVLAGSRGHAAQIVGESTSFPSSIDHTSKRAEDPAPPASRLACRRIRARIESDILGGAFTGSRRLPSQKEMTHRYGTSFRTLRASLQSLASDHILSEQGRGYAMLTPGPVHWRSRVAVLGLASPDGQLLMGDLDLAVLHALGSECTRAGVDVDIVGFPACTGAPIVYTNVHTGATAAELRTTPEVLGYVLLAIHPDGAPEPLLRRLTSLGKPVAVLDELGEYAWPAWFIRSAGVRFFTMTATQTPGRRVAQFCLARGYSSVAFISPFHYYRYSRQRCQGLSETYRAAGSGATVAICARSDTSLPEFERRSRRVDTHAIRESYASWRSGIPPVYAHIVDKRIEEFGRLSLYQAEIHTCCYELFEEALGRPGITAWVLANDFVAVSALDFLTERRIRVPETIALIGFDNTIEAFKRGITSYDFSPTAVAGAMLNYVARSRSLEYFRGSGVIEIEGMVVRRRTG